MEFVKAGKVRAYAVTTKTRLDALPDLPTVGEFVPGYEATGWYGVGAPKGTSADVITKLNAAMTPFASGRAMSITRPAGILGVFSGRCEQPAQ
jgi:tripartite-type tricarboxylate transporter receptor subunit TctC